MRSPDAQQDQHQDQAGREDQVTPNGRKPSEQALQAVDVAFGAVPTVAEAVRTTAETWTNSETRSQEIETLQKRVKTLRDPQARTTEIESLRERLSSEIEKAETKGGDVRRKVTDQLVDQARKARERVEPVYRDRVEPVSRSGSSPSIASASSRLSRSAWSPSTGTASSRR